MPPLSPREELLKLQKKIFHTNDSFIKDQASVTELGFERYEQDYKKHVHGYKSVSDIEDLTQAILKNELVFIGDYHTNHQSQRTLLRLLKRLVPKTKNIALGLELVQKKHQKVLDRYLQGDIDEATFLKKIQFKKYWYFDLWENFKPIFDFAKYHKIPIYGIEWCSTLACSLRKRDKESGKIIADVIKQNPHRKFFVLAGDLHVAPSHLPREVSKNLTAQGLKKKQLIIFQNSEEIYWTLAEKALEEKVEIVKLADGNFCVLNTPPIVWQQSYLNWLEQEGSDIDFADARGTFMELMHRIAHFLDIELPEEANDVEIFTCGDLSFLERLKKDPYFDRQELRRIKSQILASESYSIPHKKIVYLANLSLNHAAEEATHYIRYLSAGQEFPRRIVDAFYMNILHEALGFFGSKIINHKRKAMHAKDYRSLLNYLTQTKLKHERVAQFEMASLILDHAHNDKTGEAIRYQKLLGDNPDLFFGVTHGIGYILGDKLYYGLMNGKIQKDQIRELFQEPLADDGEPVEAYMNWVRKTKGVKIPKRV